MLALRRSPVEPAGSNQESVKVRGQAGHAAFASVVPRKAGYQRRKVSSRSPLRTLVRVCSRRCAPRGVHRICGFFTNRLLITGGSKISSRAGSTCVGSVSLSKAERSRYTPTGHNKEANSVPILPQSGERQEVGGRVSGRSRVVVLSRRVGRLGLGAPIEAESAECERGRGRGKVWE